LLKEARAQFPNHHFVVTCGPAEEAEAGRVAQGFDDIEIKSGLQAPELLQLLSRASVVVGTASGVIHLAAHLGVPTVAMCNLSDPCWLPSYNSAVILLSERRRCKCNGDKTGECGVETPEGLVYACLYDITTESIIDAMKAKIPAYA
jgi:ADP-heptose:LPS heptosyltransferase